MSTNKLEHVAIIMDGNGRWAKERDMPRSMGHVYGADRIEDIIDYAVSHGVKVLTLYAFSTENWNRPQDEVNALMKLLGDFLKEKKNKFDTEQIAFRVSGRIDGFTQELQDSMNDLIEFTKNNKKLTLVIALNYGGRSEIVDAAKKIAEKIRNNTLNPEDINEELFAKYLYNPDLCDPDLVIRTSGEFRISNFLLWESAYSEYFITDKYFPDFDEELFNEAVESYYKRDRRKGKIEDDNDV